MAFDVQTFLTRVGSRICATRAPPCQSLHRGRWFHLRPGLFRRKGQNACRCGYRRVLAFFRW